MSDTELTTLEQHLLLAIVGLHPNAYGVSIQEHIKERTGREPSTGSVYAAIDRLEEKGFVKSRQASRRKSGAASVSSISPSPPPGSTR